MISRSSVILACCLSMFVCRSVKSGSASKPCPLAIVVSAGCFHTQRGDGRFLSNLDNLNINITSLKRKQSFHETKKRKTPC
uniref:Putative secreted protein n=1 Tax=Anopheles darlingi TaxID=43151 RepID=A0A2M4DEN8_ANODA